MGTLAKTKTHNVVEAMAEVLQRAGVRYVFAIPAVK